MYMDICICKYIHMYVKDSVPLFVMIPDDRLDSLHHFPGSGSASGRVAGGGTVSVRILTPHEVKQGGVQTSSP